MKIADMDGEKVFIYITSWSWMGAGLLCDLLLSEVRIKAGTHDFLNMRFGAEVQTDNEITCCYGSIITMGK